MVYPFKSTVISLSSIRQVSTLSVLFDCVGAGYFASVVKSMLPVSLIVPPAEALATASSNEATLLTSTVAANTVNGIIDTAISAARTSEINFFEFLI